VGFPARPEGTWWHLDALSTLLASPPQVLGVASTYGEKIVLNSARRYGRPGGNPPPAGYNPIPAYGRHTDDGQDVDPDDVPPPPGGYDAGADPAGAPWSDEPGDAPEGGRFRRGLPRRPGRRGPAEQGQPRQPFGEDRLQPLYDDQGYGPYDDPSPSDPGGYEPPAPAGGYDPPASRGYPPRAAAPPPDRYDQTAARRYGQRSPRGYEGADQTGPGGGSQPPGSPDDGDGDQTAPPRGYERPARPPGRPRPGRLSPYESPYDRSTPAGYEQGGTSGGYERPGTSTGWGQATPTPSGYDPSTPRGYQRPGPAGRYGQGGRPGGYDQPDPTGGYGRGGSTGRSYRAPTTGSTGAYGPTTGPVPTYGRGPGYDQPAGYQQDDTGYGTAVPGYDTGSGSYGAPASYGYGQDGGYGGSDTGSYAPVTGETSYGTGPLSAPEGLRLPPSGPTAVPPGGYPDAPGHPGHPGLDYGAEEADDPPAPRRRLRPPAGQRPPRQKVPEPDDDGPQLPFVPGFAGLRALALLAVLGWGAGLSALKGGYLGISSVFTLSGFLVATLALAEWSQHNQLFLARFWERRARRLVPPYVVVLAVVVALQVVLRVGSGPTFRGDLLSSVGFATNWRLAYPAEGFARSFAELSAVRHLWPIAITVQVLVLFPLVFWLLMNVTGRKWRAVGGLFALLAAASFGAAWMVADRPGGRDLAFYGTHTRVGEILVGVVLGYLLLTPAFRKVMSRPRVMPAVRWGALGALGVLALLWILVPIDSSRLFHGVTIANAVLTAWVILAATLPGPANSALGVTPLRYLGQISYATYLVYWPVYLLLDEDRTGQDGIVLAAARIGAAVAAGALLHWAVQIPMRRARLNRQSLGAGLLGCGVAIVAVAMVLPVKPPANISLTIDDGNGPGDIDAVVPEGGSEAASVLLVGDQTAGSLVTGFEAWNGENTDDQVRVHTHVTPDCPMGGPGDMRRLGATSEASTDCEAWRPRLPRMVDEADYDVVVVVMGVADLGERQIDNQWHHLGEPAYDRWIASQIDGLADVLAEPGVPVLWVTQPHERLTDPDDDSSDWTEFDDNDPYRVDRLNELVASVIRERDGFELVDLDSWLHDQARGEFNPGLRDAAGFTEEGAAQVTTWLGDQVVSAAGGAGAGGSGGSGSGESEPES
jgi:peptidoglycan/LPS O-acetylase OafA/YrhL